MDQPMLSHHQALIYTMVLISAADSEMSDAELETIGEIVRYLPIFKDFEVSQITQVASACVELLQDSAGLDKATGLIKEALPKPLRETAYAVACDVAAADGVVHPEELRPLETPRPPPEIGRLTADALAQGTAARARPHTVHDRRHRRRRRGVRHLPARE